MTSPFDLFAVVGSRQWDFVYHLVVFIALEAGLAMAVDAWRRQHRPEARRLAIGLGALLVLRLIPLAAALLLSAGVALPPAWLVPLERALDTICMAVILYAFVFTAPASRGLAGPFIGTTIALVMVGYVALTRQWALDYAADLSLVYNYSWQAYVWAGWQIGLCLIGLFGLWRARQQVQVGSVLVALLVLAGARGLEMLFPWLDTDIAVWARLANVLIYPVLAAIAYRQGQLGLGIASSETLAWPTHAESLAEQVVVLMDETSQFSATASAKQKPEPQLDVALRSVLGLSRLLGADQAAIGLLEGDKEDRMRLVAVYNPGRRGQSGEVVTFPLDEQMAIRRALRRQEQVLVGGADDIVQLKFLYSLMGSSETGPLLVQPLLFQGRPIGAFIAGNGNSKQSFSFTATKIASSLAELVSITLAAPRVISRLEADLDQHTKQGSSRETEWGERMQTLDRELQMERESAQLFAGRLADVERDNKSKYVEIERIGRRLLLQEEETRRYQQEAAALAKKIETLARTKLTLEDELRGYREQIHELERMIGKGEQPRPLERG